MKEFSASSRVRSFGFALVGLAHMLRTQHNAWIHLAATFVAVAAGIWFHITANDWRWLIVTIALVWTAEATNTAFEHVCDVVSPEFREAVKHAKDIAAGAVLVSAAGALCLGVLVFWPYVSTGIG